MNVMRCGATGVTPRPTLRRRPRGRNVVTLPLAAAAESLGDGRDVLALRTGRPWWSSPYDDLILGFAVPTFAANLVLPLNSAVDTAVVGRLGTAQLSGVAVSVAAISLLSSSFSFLAVLAAPYVAQKTAEGNHAEVSMYVAQSLQFALAVGLGIALLIVTQVQPILNILKPAAEVLPFAEQYLKTAAVCLPGSVLILCCSGVLRGVKDSGTILISSFIVGLVNSVLDCLFVFGFGWSVSGAAWASVCSVYAGLTFSLYRILTRKLVRPQDLLQSPRLNIIAEILDAGARLSLKSILLVGMFATSTILMAKQGAISMTVYEISRQCASIAWMINLTLDQTIQTLTAQMLGQKKFKTARGVILRILQMAFWAVAGIVFVAIVGAKQAATIFTSDPAVIAEYTKIAPCVLPLIPIVAVVAMIDGSLIGASKVKFVAPAQAIGYFTAILMLFGCHYLGTLTPLTVWFIVRFGMAFSGLITGPYLFRSQSSPYGFDLLPSPKRRGPQLD